MYILFHDIRCLGKTKRCSTSLLWGHQLQSSSNWYKSQCIDLHRNVWFILEDVLLTQAAPFSLINKLKVEVGLISHQKGKARPIGL